MSAVSFEDAKARTARAQAALDSVWRAKRAAALTPAGTDINARNLERARREKWTDGSLGNLHSPEQ